MDMRALAIFQTATLNLQSSHKLCFCAAKILYPPTPTLWKPHPLDAMLSLGGVGGRRSSNDGLPWGGGGCKGISKQSVVPSMMARVRDQGRFGGLGLLVNCTLSAVLSATMGMGFKKAFNVDCKQRFWQGGRPVQILDPNRVQKLLGVWRGGGGGGVGGSAGVPRGGSVGTPTYIPQNDPHDALIILNTHKWGKKNFQKKSAH